MFRLNYRKGKHVSIDEFEIINCIDFCKNGHAFGSHVVIFIIHGEYIPYISDFV